MKGKTADTAAMAAAIAAIPAIQAELDASDLVARKWTVRIEIVNGGVDFMHTASTLHRTRKFCAGSDESVVEHCSGDTTELIENIAAFELSRDLAKFSEFAKTVLARSNRAPRTGAMADTALMSNRLSVRTPEGIS